MAIQTNLGKNAYEKTNRLASVPMSFESLTGTEQDILIKLPPRILITDVILVTNNAAQADATMSVHLDDTEIFADSAIGVAGTISHDSTLRDMAFASTIAVTPSEQLTLGNFTIYVKFLDGITSSGLLLQY